LEEKFAKTVRNLAMAVLNKVVQCDCLALKTL